MTGNSEDTAAMQALPPARAAEIQQAQAAMPSDHSDIIHALGTAVETLWPYAKGFLKATLWPAGMQRQWQLEDEARKGAETQDLLAQLRALQGGQGGTATASASSPPPSPMPITQPLSGTPRIQAASTQATPDLTGNPPNLNGDLLANLVAAAHGGVAQPGRIGIGNGATNTEQGPWNPANGGYTSASDSRVFGSAPSSTAGVPGAAPAPAPTAVASAPTTAPASRQRTSFSASIPLPTGGRVTIGGGTSPGGADARNRRIDLEMAWNGAYQEALGAAAAAGMNRADASTYAYNAATKATNFTPTGERGVYSGLVKQGIDIGTTQQKADIAVNTAARKADAVANAPQKISSGERKDAAPWMAIADASQDLKEQFQHAQSLIGPLAGRGGSIEDVIGGNSQADAAFRAANSTLANMIIYARSGKQINAQELDRIWQELPNFQKFNYNAWVGKFTNAVNIVYRELAARNRIAERSKLAGREFYTDAMGQMESAFPTILAREMKRWGRSAPTAAQPEAVPTPAPQPVELPSGTSSAVAAPLPADYNSLVDGAR